MAKIRKTDLPREYQEIWDNLIMDVDTNISIDSVILNDENKEKIRAFLKETQYRDRLYEYGLEPMNRILMYGASGTGKTYLTKALSNTLNYTMIYVDIAKSLSEGNVAENISSIFKLGNYIGEAILFFDECDSIAWARDSGNAERGDVRRATNSLFQNLDQMNHKCIFCSATNMLHRIDPAFERRFNMKMAFPKPQLDIDDSIKHFIFPKFVIDDDVDSTTREIVKRRASNYQKLSYYELEELVKRAMKRAVLSNTNVVKVSGIYQDLQTSMHFKIKYDQEEDEKQILNNTMHYNADPAEEIKARRF